MSEELRNENLQEDDDIFAGLNDYAAEETAAQNDIDEDEAATPDAVLDQDNLEGFAKGFPDWALEPPTWFLKKQAKN